MRSICYLRKSYGLSQRELVKRLNSMYDCSISRERIILFECNFRKPDESTAKILAEFFNVSVETIKENKKVEN